MRFRTRVLRAGKTATGVEVAAEPPEGLVELAALAARINARNDSSGPRRSSLPTSTPTMRPRHPGGRWKSQLNRTSVPPSLVSVSVTCSWLVTPNGRWTIKSAHRCCGSTSRTSILTGHSRPKPRAARSITRSAGLAPACEQRDSNDQESDRPHQQHRQAQARGRVAEAHGRLARQLSRRAQVRPEREVHPGGVL